MRDTNREQFDKLKSEKLFKEKRFEILPEHLKLLQAMCVGWQDDEFGAPEIDPKRPYGNRDVYQDMVETLGFEEIDDQRFLFKLFGKEYTLRGEDRYNIDLNYEKKLIEILEKLHKETEIALQLCLSVQKFEPGTYLWHEYQTDYIKEEKS